MATTGTGETTTTLRDRAIALRLRWISAETGKHFRGCEEMSAAEKREASRLHVEAWRSQLATLRAMPETASDDEVRRAMGVA